VIEAFAIGAGLGGTLMLGRYAEAKLCARRARKDFELTQKQRQQVNLDWAYDTGKLAGRIQRQIEGPGSRPTFWASDDPETMQQRRGVQDGWAEADKECSEAEAWVVDEAERILREGR
jgi:hypothetical protein